MQSLVTVSLIINSFFYHVLCKRKEKKKKSLYCCSSSQRHNEAFNMEQTLLKFSLQVQDGSIEDIFV